MDIESVKVVYFSPTGTTEKVVQAIAEGTNYGNVEFIDITRPDERTRTLQTTSKQLLVMAVPVYMGRVPALLSDWLHTIDAQETPAVCVVVYGNRVYEDALIELKDILNQCGCRTIAGAAFIGEHSFSRDETPTAKDRPDESDINHALLFGRKINEKILGSSSIDMVSDVNLPGCHPYRGDSKLWTVDFISVSDGCTQCGICNQVCPVGAINQENCTLIDIERCITCCACIKKCPNNARTMKPGLVMDASVRLHTLYPERKEPEYFL